MKKYLFSLLIVCLAAISTVQADNDNHKNSKREQLNAQKRIFLVQKMELTETEETAFLALYDDYEAKMKVSKKALRSIKKSLNDESTDADYPVYIQALIDTENEQNTLRHNLLEEMTKIMPAKKVFLFIKGEKEFCKMMMRDAEKNIKIGQKK